MHTIQPTARARRNTHKTNPAATPLNTLCVCVVVGRQGDWDAARTFMAAMAAEHGVKPNKRSYAELISACARAGEFEEAIAAFKTMREHGVTPDIVLFSALITACANAGRCAEVKSTSKAHLFLLRFSTPR